MRDRNWGRHGCFCAGRKLRVAVAQPVDGEDGEQGRQQRNRQENVAAKPADSPISAAAALDPAVQLSAALMISGDDSDCLSVRQLRAHPRQMVGEHLPPVVHRQGTRGNGQLGKLADPAEDLEF